MKEIIEEKFPETHLYKYKGLSHAKENEWKRHSPTYILGKCHNHKDKEKKIPKLSEIT